MSLLTFFWVFFYFFFFFSSRRRHTRFDCDWSSDVCSSDLSLAFQLGSRPGILTAPALVSLEKNQFPVEPVRFKTTLKPFSSLEWLARVSGNSSPFVSMGAMDWMPGLEKAPRRSSLKGNAEPGAPSG